MNQGPCVLLERKPMAPPYRVDEKLCDGCRRCIMIACPSLSLKGKGKKAKAVVERNTCYGCRLSAHVCTRDAISSEGKQ